MTEPSLNLDRGFTVSVYFPPGSDPDWVSEFLARVAEDAYSMPSDSLDAFVVGHACDMLGIDDERAEADRYAAMVNAPLRPETIVAIAERIKSGDLPVRKVRARARDMGREPAVLAIPPKELEPLLALAEDPPTLTAEQLARLDQDGVDTTGCDCGHPGMGAAWHQGWCAWRKEQW